MAGNLQGRVLHIDQHLSNVAINTRPSVNGWVWDRVFPIVNVQKQTDLYVTFHQPDLFRRPDTKRAPGDEAKVVTYAVGSESYIAQGYALKLRNTLEDRVNADPILRNEIGNVQRIMDFLNLDAEVRVASLAFNTGNVGSNSAVESAWTDRTNADPVEDIFEAIDNVHYGIGYRPNKLLFGARAWTNFARNENVIDAAMNPNVTGGGGRAAMERIQTLFQVDEVIVGNGVYNTAEKGLPASYSEIWADSVLVYYTPSAPSREEPSFGYSFRWAPAGLPNMSVIRHPFDSRRMTEEVEVAYWQDERVTGSDFAFLLTNVTSSQSGI